MSTGITLQTGLRDFANNVIVYFKGFILITSLLLFIIIFIIHCFINFHDYQSPIQEHTPCLISQLHYYAIM